MKKFLFVLFGVFAFSGAFAAGENIPTSKSYVDAAVAQKQDKISASIIVPAGYTQLQYIESTGTQYIDTGYIPNQSSGVKTKVRFNSVANNKTFVFGSAQAYNSKAFEFYLWDGRPEFNYGDGGDRFANNYMAIDDALELDWNKNIVNYSINNFQQQAINYPTGVSFVTPYTMYIFAIHRPGGAAPGLVGSIYYFKIYDNGTLVRDMVPARRDSDNVVGMYDTISGQFFTNSGTGEFIAGPVIPDIQVLTNTGTAGEYGTRGIYDATDEYAVQTQNLVDAATMNAGVQNAIDSEFQCISWVDDDPTKDCLLFDVLGGRLPPGYTALEYIESTGTQWIDTGVIPTVNTKARVKFLTTGQCGDFGLFGARKDPYRFNATTFNRGSQIGFGMTNNSWPVNRMPCQLNSIYDCTMSNGYAKVNDTEYLETPVSESEWSPDVGTFKLASLNGAGTVVLDEYASRGVRWYVVQLWESNVLIRDFIPVRRDGDKAIGMYDTISGRFFTNSGTGGFIPGPVVGAGVYLPSGN